MKYKKYEYYKNTCTRISYYKLVILLLCKVLAYIQISSNVDFIVNKIKNLIT